ncbi:IS21 family transposase [Acinetobacter lwoffii]|uniref:IS21 family transposase n=1 Tax=Acinetobacter lwoffii TaxID=28090 RepID=UPI003F8CF7FF
MNTSIKKIRLVVAYLFNCQSNREIARIVVVSRETVAKIKTLLSESELTYDEFTTLSNSELEVKLGITRSIKHTKKPQPNAALLCKELETHKGLTMSVLWEEYLEQTNGNGVGYTRFCEIIRKEQKNNKISQIQIYYPGETAEIDYSGDLVDIDLSNGDLLKANIFVGVLPFSDWIFCYATKTQKTEDWIRGCIQMFNKMNGIPQTIVCDNAKALITKHKNRIVEINPYFQEFLEFHKINVLPARPRKPKDKAVGENAVNIVQKQILMRMRNEKFSSFEAFNERLEYMIDSYNHKKTKTFPEGRMVIFSSQEKDKLKPLPNIPFQSLSHYITTVVPTNYHIVYLKNSYSVPHQYIRKNVNIKVLDNNLHVYYEKNIIAKHLLLVGTGKISTLDEHKTDNHRIKDYLTKESLLSWSESTGVNTFNYCNFIINKDQNLYNNLNYLFDLRDWVNNMNFIDRLELALTYAFKLKIQNLARLKSIIETKSYLDIGKRIVKNHKNLRGANYYKEVEKC